MTQHGKVRYELNTPYRDGTSHVFFDPIDFIGKLVSLIPPPRLNLTRFFGYLRQTATFEHKLPHHSEIRTALYSPKKGMRHRKNLTTLGR
jgi:hypothetical protein